MRVRFFQAKLPTEQSEPHTVPTGRRGRIFIGGGDTGNVQSESVFVLTYCYQLCVRLNSINCQAD
jgi:hypothetical protein